MEAGDRSLLNEERGIFLKLPTELKVNNFHLQTCTRVTALVWCVCSIWCGSNTCMRSQLSTLEQPVSSDK